MIYVQDSGRSLASFFRKWPNYGYGSKVLPQGDGLPPPWFRIHRTQHRVGAPLVGVWSKDRHEACAYVGVVIELRQVGSAERRDYSSNGA